MYSLINLLSWITVKRVYMAYLGQKLISNFLTKPGFHMVDMNWAQLFVIMNLMHLRSQIKKSWHANCLLLDIDQSYTSCMSTLDDIMSIRS